MGTKPTKKAPKAAKKPKTKKSTPVAAPPPRPGAATVEHDPLDGRPGTGSDTAVIAAHPHIGKIDLRGDAGDKGFLAAVKQAAGAAPPVKANTVAMAGRNTILWLGPDEWLVLVPPRAQAAMEAALTQALDGHHVSVVDVTDARATIRLHGAYARAVLEKGCPLDLHGRAFAAGQCAQTKLAKADILIHQIDDAPTYDLHVACSFSRYLWDWLVDAAREFT